MRFSDVLKDVHKLVGLELSSINDGASLTITEIDDKRGRLIIRPQKGRVRSRPVNELQRIWDAMQVSPAVHVDKVLGGSGTSRNQPETILANLPYIEWLRIDKKKHIAYVVQHTHQYGTLQAMDQLKVAEIKDKLESVNKKSLYSAVIVSKDVLTSISTFLNICSGKCSTIEQGVYQIETNTNTILFLTSEASGLDEGTYGVIDAHEHKAGTTVKNLSFNGYQYALFCSGNIKLLIRA